MQNKPVILGENYEIEITGFSHQGEGIGRINNFAIFIPGAILGEKIITKIIEVKKNRAKGELIKILSRSSSRVEPACAWAGKCGGCRLQHLSYEKQLDLKRNIVKDALNKLANLELDVLPTLGMEYPWRYRNKGHFHVKKVEGEIRLGFYEPGSYDFVPAKESLLFSLEVNKLVGYLEEILTLQGIEAYDRKAGRGYLRNVLIRESKASGELMVVFITNENKWKLADVIKSLTKVFPKIVSIYQNINQQKRAPLLGPIFELHMGQATIQDSIGSFLFKISPQSFFQVNNIQTKILYDKVAEYASLTGKETVIDAYCGLGSIAIFLANKAKSIYGIEIIESAIKDAKENAYLNGITNAEFITGKVEEWLPQWVEKGGKAEIIVVDPPRKGCALETLEAIAEVKPKRIIYVSCNPATLARDLKYLVEKGFEVKEVQPVDLFPQTRHVECVTLMSRVEK